MPWVYLDDHFDEHPKVLEAESLHQLAPWLFVCGLCYCRRRQNGGNIPSVQVRKLNGFSKRAKDALVAVGLWNEYPDGNVAVHDYEEWNHSEVRKRAAQKAASARWSFLRNA